MISHYTATEIISPDAVVFVDRFISASLLSLSLLFVEVLLDRYVQQLNRLPLVLMLVTTVDRDLDTCRLVGGDNTRVSLVLMLPARTLASGVAEVDISLANLHIPSPIM